MRISATNILTILTLFIFATEASAAVIPGTDSLYPTGYAAWPCQNSNPNENHFCLADNATHTFGTESTLTSAQKNFINSVMFSQFDPTVLTVKTESPIAYTGSAETDIVFQAGSVGEGYAGVTWCDDSSIGNNRCDQHYSRMIPSAISALSPNSGIPCHEAGHTLGLTHGSMASPPTSDIDPNLDCMATPPLTIGILGLHNSNQINGGY